MELAERRFRQDCDHFKVWHSGLRNITPRDLHEIEHHKQRLRRQAIELGYIHIEVKE